MKTKNLIYTINKNTQGGYSHLYLEIREIGSRFGGRETALTLKWQLHRPEAMDSNSPRNWYGLHTTITGNRLGEIATVAKVAAQINNSLEKRAQSDTWRKGDSTPENVIEVLEELKIARAVYDGRQSNYVRISDLPDDAVFAWSNGTTSILAGCEREAKRKLAIATAEFSVSSLEQWIAKGSPITRRDDRAPLVETLADVLKDPFVSAAPVAN